MPLPVSYVYGYTVAKWLIGPGYRLGGEWGWSMDGYIRWGRDRRRGRDSFGGKCGASLCNQWGLCCVFYAV